MPEEASVETNESAKCDDNDNNITQENLDRLNAKEDPNVSYKTASQGFNIGNQLLFPFTLKYEDNLKVVLVGVFNSMLKVCNVMEQMNTEHMITMYRIEDNNDLKSY